MIVSRGILSLAALAFLGLESSQAFTFPAKTTHSSSLYATQQVEEEEKKVPITLLAGFLGSGKTTTLENLLKNNQGQKIGIVVNDVASINIDNKLLANPDVSSTGGTIELQNGCACCSLSDELLTSIEQLMTAEDGTQRDFDSIVVELSGVADPKAVRDNWENASWVKHPATKYATMDKVVTLVDADTFGTDWMTWDTSGDRQGWVDPADCEADKKVPELLSEQIESADVLVINKIDLAGEEQTKVATSLAKILNQKATLYETKFGDISVKQILDAGKIERDVDEKKKDDEACNDPDCTEDHSHSHDHSADPTCTEDHSAETCNDPACTDESHSHTHSHSHSHNTSTENLGITNFVYKRDRPFNPSRLLVALNMWPVPVVDTLDLGELTNPPTKSSDEEQEEASPFQGLLRSKGFCWMAPTSWNGPMEDIWRHNTKMYWSHAGKHFSVSTSGKWWAELTKDQLKIVFSQNEKELNRILTEDFVSDEFGDRRQEIVFIGANIDEEAITKELDECLCTDAEMENYRVQLKMYEDSLVKPAFKTSARKKPSKKKVDEPVDIPKVVGPPEDDE
ncbi:hypothetical protein CTEN210_06671 [Chaetoceros tenuissimus]|uniref:CobW C-terminal domain-containing protein n=1 Tax=Chaetoceros tenuissimus TaxID=426638 RepID=A0AAD3H4L8_9STRA|nr:hypothetical protein CTEN210_06671 [Chaetoceros tenuissimus]